MWTAIGVAALWAVACASRTPPAALPPLDAPRQARFTAAELGEYRLRPGDLLRVKYLYHPELDVKTAVRPDGIVTLQIAGDIDAAGSTTGDLARVIVQRTRDRLREPEVSVMVAEVADRKIYVGGEVRVPGFVPYRPGMSPLQAIMDRGGFTDTARTDSVLRLSAAEADYQGTRLDLRPSLVAGLPEGVQLLAGDVLYVPRTFIGDVNAFVRLYLRGVLPVEPRIGAGGTF